MKLRIVALVFAASLLVGRMEAQTSGADIADKSLLDIERVYVEPLTGGAQAGALRALLIASLDSTKLFILTDNAERADAVLKGAADDHTFVESFDSRESLSGRMSGHGNGGSSRYAGLSVGENEAHHDRERRHEAYAAVRLCNRDGDVIWSTTQESQGGKFRSASADVAAKVAHQLTLDFKRERSAAKVPPATPSPKP